MVINVMNVYNIIAEKYYKEARDFARSSEKGKVFTDHCKDHVFMVATKTRGVSSAVNLAITNNAMGKHRRANRIALRQSEAIQDVLDGAALSHDTGMSGTGYAIPNVKKLPKGSLYTARVLNAQDFDEVRDNHPLNSALNVLINKQVYKSLGYSSDQINILAVLCLTHSKSTSGLTDIHSLSEWKDCIDRLQACIEAYNHDHLDMPLVFDSSRFLRDPLFLGQVASACLALRVGDVSRDSGPNAISQSGEIICIDRTKLNNSAGTMAGEVLNVPITLGEKHEPVTIEFSRCVHAGEQNIVNSDTYFDYIKKCVVHVIQISDGNSAPLCTQQAIMEHIKEFASAADEKFIVEIIFLTECDEPIKKSYMRFRDKAFSIADNCTLAFSWEKEELA